MAPPFATHQCRRSRRFLCHPGTCQHKRILRLVKRLGLGFQLILTEACSAAEGPSMDHLRTGRVLCLVGSVISGALARCRKLVGSDV